MKTGNKQKRVLLVMSSVDEMGISGKQTGTWFTELAAPYYILTEAGFEVVFASPNGGAAPIDLLSMKAPFTTEHTERFFNDPVAMFAAIGVSKPCDPRNATRYVLANAIDSAMRELVRLVRAALPASARLARSAGRTGALDGCLKRGSGGWRHRLALIEAADLSWFVDDRFGPARLALWIFMRLSGV